MKWRKIKIHLYFVSWMNLRVHPGLDGRRPGKFTSACQVYHFKGIYYAGKFSQRENTVFTEILSRCIKKIDEFEPVSKMEALTLKK